MKNFIRQHSLDVVDSTNSEIKRILLAQAALGQRLDSGYCLMAHRQTHGRGRLARTWSSLSQGLMASFWLEAANKSHPGAGFCLPADLLLPLPLVSALAVVDCLKSLAQEMAVPELDLRCKWPNDVLCQGRKLAGILCEYQETTQQIGVVVGIGINLSATAEELASVDKPATSWLVETGCRTDTGRVFSLLAEALYSRWQLLAEEGFEKMAQEWYSLCSHRQQEVAVYLLGNGQTSLKTTSGHSCQADATSRGLTVGLSKSGELLLEIQDSSGQRLIKAVMSGDIEPCK